MTDFRVTLNEINETEASMQALERDAACVDAMTYVKQIRDPAMCSFFDDAHCHPKLPTLEMLAGHYEISWTDKLKTTPEEIAACRRRNALRRLEQIAEHERIRPSRDNRDAMRKYMALYDISIEEVDAAINATRPPGDRWLARHFEVANGH